MRIYISSPWRKGHVAVHLRRALKVGEVLLEMGHAPFVPHLWHFWEMQSAKIGEQTERMELGWLAVCEAILFLGQAPKKNTPLYAFARLNGQRVFRGLNHFLKTVNARLRRDAL